MINTPCPPAATHIFTRSEIHRAEHLFAERIKKTFGEVWRIGRDGKYKGVNWVCVSPLQFDLGIWKLCQAARHRDAIRAAGRIESADTGHKLIFILLYESVGVII